jgi:hypothetical protein
VLNAFMESWAAAARQLLARRNVAVLGPAPPLVPRVKNRYREQMLLKGAIQQADKDAVLAAFKDLSGSRARMASRESSNVIVINATHGSRPLSTFRTSGWRRSGLPFAPLGQQMTDLPARAPLQNSP